jgi:hypothetical protein
MPKKPPSVARRVLNAQEAGTYLNKSSSTIRRMARRKELPYIKGKARRAPYGFDIFELDAWVERSKIAI